MLKAIVASVLVVTALATQMNDKRVHKAHRLLQRRAQLGGDGHDSRPHGKGGVPQIIFCNTTMTPLVVNSYEIKPDNIQPNEDVEIILHSTLTETVTSGKIYETLKVDGFTVLKQNYDLCTEIAQGGLSCPLAPGPYDFDQTIHIGSIPISGNVDAKTELTDQNNKQLACVELKVSV